MSTLDEVDAAVQAILDTNKNASYAVLHCNSSYPAPNNDLNLKCIQTLKDRYNCEVGYSGHEFGLTTTIASICMGSTIIERHITISHEMWGTDQSASLEVHAMDMLQKRLQNIDKILGDGKKIVTKSELPIKSKLRG